MTPGGDKPWHALRDEEPPERGLAELMAAARIKAEVMARPPWWKRALELLRRPPVLALATIVVLLGGVLVVGRHPGAPQASSPERVEPVVAPPAPAERATPADMPSAPRAADDLPSQVVTSPPGAPPPPAAPPRRGSSPSHASKTSTSPRSAPRARDPEASTGQALDLATPDTTEATADDAPVPTGVIGAPQNHGTAAAEPKAAAAAAEPKAVAPDPLARCRAAAARKDCAAAKACAREVEMADPSYYRANASKDAALRPCL